MQLEVREQVDWRPGQAAVTLHHLQPGGSGTFCRARDVDRASIARMQTLARLRLLLLLPGEMVHAQPADWLQSCDLRFAAVRSDDLTMSFAWDCCVHLSHVARGCGRQAPGGRQPCSGVADHGVGVRREAEVVVCARMKTLGSLHGC